MDADREFQLFKGEKKLLFLNLNLISTVIQTH